MAPLTALRVCLLVFFSAFVTVSLGFGLPVLLNAVTGLLGVPEASVSECVVVSYLLFVLYVATPRIPRGLVEDKGGESAKILEDFHSERMKVVQLDVSSNEQVNRAAHFVRDNLEDSERGLWALVNNASVSTFGGVEFTSMEAYKEVSEINLWGTIRVTKALLPLIRRAKGRVVNMSGLYGRMGNIAQSPVSVSKYGMEAFFDCLRYEMKSWGIKVSVVEPGNFAAEILSRDVLASAANKQWAEASPDVRDDYGKARFDQIMALIRSQCNGGQKDVGPLLDAMVDAVMSKHPYTRYNAMEPYWWIRLQLMTHLPTVLSDLLYF
ncbi:D-beta-hydroxybutyrate dehydrogenase, mitochondrial isoform X2 [Syngnathus typhle]|uniref:D-beta-hydroxybutyrate dehydrogenase, mitochondrial isoform X2 n=1 Tax=Syngnathus typhle TaxID=161592 RepID=UPI002A69DD47|nr:D-beta-hydroxybutyrate dehydrogenase, mitochondrial isoform X2 [Syngnathus typhle]